MDEGTDPRPLDFDRVSESIHIGSSIYHTIQNDSDVTSDHA